MMYDTHTATTFLWVFCNMMTLNDIRIALQDRRIGLVAQATGLHVNTIRDLRDGENANPSYRVLAALSDYLEKNAAKIEG